MEEKLKAAGQYAGPFTPGAKYAPWIKMDPNMVANAENAARPGR
jgi:hypothetical protein